MLLRVRNTGLGAATAHFTDVPADHQLFPYVERVYAAGLTTGCSIDPPKFCPDETVTRGQLAVFLSRMVDAQTASASPVNSPDPEASGGWSIAGIKVSPTMAIGAVLILVALLRR